MIKPLSFFTADIIQEAVDNEVKWMFGDSIGQGYGIGSSDVGACVRAVIQALEEEFAVKITVENTERMFLRGMVSAALCDLEENV